jgi:hypothetical protein
MNLGRTQWAFIAVASLTIIVLAPNDNESASVSQAKPAKQRVTTNASAPSNSDKQTSQAVGRVELERLVKLGKPKNEQGSVGDAFNNLSWYVPPPVKPQAYEPPPPPPPPPVPTAPPLPFTFLGRYDDSVSLVIILTKGDRVYTVSVGDVIENTYKVEKLTAGVLTFTYLPLKIEQKLRIGEAS